MDVVFQTRFSFFGKSGWKSAAAADPDLLFAPERLDARLRLFELITLPSLLAQSDPDFTHMVLSSTLMPTPYKVRLRELVQDTLGPGRARVMFRPEGSAGGFLRQSMAKTFGNKPCAQVVLDDDDAVSDDYVAVLRGYAQAALAAPGREDDYMFISFPRGYTLLIEDGAPVALEHRFVSYTNLGLALVAPGNHKRNPFMTSHRRIGQRHPSLMVTSRRPFYLRALHRHNDSNAHKQDLELAPHDMTLALRHFPFLGRHFGPDGTRLAAE